MVINVQQQGYDIVHLRKKLFRKYGEKYFINFKDCSQFKFLNEQPLTVHQKKAMIHRLNKMLSKAQIPYGLNTEGSHNCESFVKYIKKGTVEKSTEVANFEKKFGYSGKFVIFMIDHIMILTNGIGFLLCYFISKGK